MTTSDDIARTLNLRTLEELFSALTSSPTTRVDLPCQRRAVQVVVADPVDQRIVRVLVENVQVPHDLDVVFVRSESALRLVPGHEEHARESIERWIRNCREWASSGRSIPIVPSRRAQLDEALAVHSQSNMDYTGDR